MFTGQEKAAEHRRKASFWFVSLLWNVSTYFLSSIRDFTLENAHQGTGKRAPLGKYLLYKHEDPTLTPALTEQPGHDAYCSQS